MILTNTLINSAIAKAYCCVAKKIVRYISLLVVGKNNKCDFKDVKLLNKYIDILQNYEIAGDKTTCVCGVNGGYTVLLNELTEFSEAKIQFNCDNTGGMFFDNQQFPFTYVYSEVSNALVIRFDNLFSNPPTDTENTILTLQGLVFEQDCTFEPNTVSPIEVAKIIVDGTPVTVNYVNPLDEQIFDWDGELFVTDETLIPVTQNIPAENLDSPTTIVTDWNDEHHPTNNGWLLNYSSANTTYTMLSPFDGVDYAPSYAAIFQQYEGGSDSNATFENVIDIPWVTQEVLAYTELDIPDTFVGSNPASTTITPALEPFIDTPVQAKTTLLIPTNLFDSPGAKASVLFTAGDSFFRCTSNTSYINTPDSNINWVINPTEAGLNFANIEECVTYINNNLLFGYPLELINTTTITYPSIVDAIASCDFPSFSTFTAGDVINIDLNSIYFNTFNNVGTYTVLPGDTIADIIAGLIADIIAQDIFTGTVTTDINNYLYFTAPAGSGSDWNAVYFMYIVNVTADIATTPYFINGNNLTENEYTLSITAPEVGSIYNNYFSSTGFGANPYEFIQFSGGYDNSQQVSVEVADTLNGQLYYVDTNTFTSVDDFITAFNVSETTQAENIGITGEFTQVEFTAPPSNTANAIYNGETVNFSFNKVLTASGIYSGGVDTTEGQYVIDVYPTSGPPFSISNYTPTNYVDLQDLVNNINNNLGNDYFVASIVNNQIVLTTILSNADYNGYSTTLSYYYMSTSYTNYTSYPSIFENGVNKVSNPFTIGDTLTAPNPIFSKTLDSYDYSSGVQSFVEDFTDNNGLGYTAEVQGPGTDIPETIAVTSTPITTTSIVGGDYITVNINGVNIATYNVPLILPSATVIRTGISNAINDSFTYDGFSALTPSPSSPTGINVYAPPGFGENYNGSTLNIIKNTTTRASVSFEFLTGTGSGETFYIETNAGYTLPTYTASANLTAAQSAIEYAALINSTTATNGNFTAFILVSRVIVIRPSLYSGEGWNGVQLTFVANGTTTVAIPTKPFQGGVGPIPTTLNSSVFSGGRNGSTTTKVRFFPPPFPLSLPYTGTSNWANNTNLLTYNYDDFYYVVSNYYDFGVDTTEGILSLELIGAFTASYMIYEDLVNVNYASTQELIDAINDATTTNAGFSTSLENNDITVYSPEASFDYYNDSFLRLMYTYRSPQYSDFDYSTLVAINMFVSGVLPTLQTYSGTFENGNIGPFITDNPCTSTTIGESCLTNENIINIINHINKLCNC
jgi:hypothetical protein